MKMAKKNTFNTLLWTSGIINICIITLQILVIRYLYHLDSKNCECAMDYRRVYIIVFLIVFVIDSIIISIPSVRKLMLLNSNMTLGIIMRIIIFIAGIINIVFVFEYIKKLKDKKCKCSESDYRTVLYVENIIQICGISFIVLGILYMIVHIICLKITYITH